jgi:subtilisin-like proprotein convertase family protein
MTLVANARKRGAALVAGGLVAALVLAAPAAAETYENTGAITITADAGKANPYPSPIEVSGVQGIVTDVDVTLNSAFHEHFEDFDIVLGSPTGRRILLVSDACEGEVNATLTFSAGADPIPAAGPCPSDTYGPADYEPPADLEEGESPDGSGLDDLVDEDPNGTWELYVGDDSEHPSDNGTISGGWSLDIQVREPAPVAFSVAAQTVAEGSTVAVDVIRTGAAPLYEGSVTVATLSGTAVAGSDFVATSYRLDFAAGETTKTVEVPVVADGLGEPEQGFTIALGNPAGDARVGTPGAVGITIPADPGGVFDDLPTGDESPPPPPRFRASNSIRAPTARRCRRRGETIRIRPRMPSGVAIVRSEVFVNGRKVEDNIDESAVAPILLTMSGRRMRVRIRLHSHDDRVITMRRTYRRCKRSRG